VTCGLAAGWEGAHVEERTLTHRLHGETFTWNDDPSGRPTRVLADVDGRRFTERWLEAVETAHAAADSPPAEPS
jgi:hypothetical protein